MKLKDSWVVTVSVLFGVVAIITGFYLWLPSNIFPNNATINFVLGYAIGVTAVIAFFVNARYGANWMSRVWMLTAVFGMLASAYLIIAQFPENGTLNYLFGLPLFWLAVFMLVKDGVKWKPSRKR